jgi:hypothetical protein
MITFRAPPKVLTRTQFLGLSLAIVALSAATVIYQLGKPSLWVDEAYTWFFVSMPWAKMVEAVRIDAVNPPFYYVFAKVFTDVLGTSEAMLRAPSVVAYMAGLIGSLWVGYQLEGRLGAIASGWFWGFHPMLIWFARDARPYSLAATLSVLGLGLFLHMMGSERLSGRDTGLSLATVSIGLVSHYFFMLFAILTGLISTAEIRNRRRFFRAWAVVLLIGAVPLLLWLWWFFQLPTPSFGIGWISQPPLTAIGGTLWNLVSGYGAAFDWGSLVFGMVAGVLIAAGIGEHWKWVGLTVVLPVGAVWAFSQYRPVYVDRYFIVLIPFLLPAIAGGARRVIERWQGSIARFRWVGTYVGAILLLLAMLGAIHAVHTQPAYKKEQWRQVASWLNRAPAGTEVLMSEPELTLPLSYYAPDLSPAGLIGTTPCGSMCVWILRQPYTYAHAFSQSVHDPARDSWRPQVPANCQVLDDQRWESGLETRMLACSSNG